MSTRQSHLTPASEIALRAHLACLTGGRYAVSLEECFESVRAKYPVLGKVVERRDIAKALRKLRFVRDYDQAKVSYRYKSSGGVR